MMCYVHYGCLSRWTCCCTRTEAGLYVMFILCLLWMPQQKDLLLMDIFKIIMFAMDGSTDGLAVAYGHSYNFVVVLSTRLLRETAI